MTRSALLSAAATFVAATTFATVAAASASAVTVPACPASTPYRTGLYTCSEAKPARPYVLPPGTVITPAPAPGQAGWQLDAHSLRARHTSDVSYEVTRRQHAARRATPVLYVVSESRPADALAAVPLITKTGGVLYTANRYGGVYLSGHEMARYGIKRAVVIGAVPDSTIAGLRVSNSRLPITHVSAGTTQDTSARLAAAAYPTATTAYVTTAANVTDSAILASAAAKARTPLIVTPRSGLTAAQRATLRTMRVTNLVLAPDVQGATLTSLQAETAVSGQPFSLTSAPAMSGTPLSIDVAKAAFPSATTATVTATNSPAAAVVLAAHAAVMGQPLLLKSPACTPVELHQYLNGGQFTRANVLTVSPAAWGVHDGC